METSKEFWVPVRGYEGYYEISNLLNMRSVQRVVMRKDGVARIVNAKPMTTDLGGVMLSKGAIHDQVNVITKAIESFYPWYDDTKHYYTYVPNPNRTSKLYQYQVFYKLEHNSVIIQYKDGIKKEFPTVQHAAEHLKYRSAESFIAFVFKKYHCSNEHDIEYISFEHPVHYKGEIKTIVYMSAKDTVKKRMAKLKQERMLLKEAKNITTNRTSRRNILIPHAECLTL